MHKKPLLCDIKMYDQTSNFIPVNIAKDAVKLVTQNLLGGSGLGVLYLGSSTGVDFKIWEV